MNILGFENLSKPFNRKVLKYTYLGMKSRSKDVFPYCDVAVEEIELSCGHKQKYYHNGIHFSVVKCETCEKENKI
jgi:hypothetical protein